MALSDKKICASCVSEKYLNGQIDTIGQVDICSYCGDTAKTQSLGWLAEIVHSGVEEHFYLTSNQPSSYEYTLLSDKEIDYDWERKGQPINELLQDIVEVNEDVASDIQEYLSDTYTDYEDIKLGEEDPFGDEAHYEESPADQNESMESWGTLCSEIKTRARFFSPSVENILNELFGDLNLFKSFDGTPGVKVISSEHNDSVIYRARTAHTENDIEKILKSPVRELGSPPSNKARSGRMNPSGISVFYGAADIETCIAEVRPPVGSYVVLGKFEITREIRLLDMDVLTRLHFKGSYFDPESSVRWGRAAFLRQIVNELTNPVMPGDEESEYLPTQVVAEYLSEKIDPRLDGIIFHSSQIAENGKNIVLFNHASLAEPYILPNDTNVKVHFGWSSEDDSDDSITVWEESSCVTDTDSMESGHEQNNLEQASEVTLKLDVDKVEVIKINGVTYSTVPRTTSRYRSSKSDATDF